MTVAKLAFRGWTRHETLCGRFSVTFLSEALGRQNQLSLISQLRKLPGLDCWRLPIPTVGRDCGSHEERCVGDVG